MNTKVLVLIDSASACCTTEVRFVSIPTLIRMKEAAGREQDRIDIEHLRMRLEDDAGK